MSPRAYNSANRQQTAQQTRQRIVVAARTLLAGAATPQLSVESVAKRADVARQTVYNAFGSKTGLLEALCDHLAERGGMHGLRAVFAAPTMAARLDGLVGVFCQFWRADRLATRRLRGLAALDADLAAVVRSRDERRRRAIAAVLQLSSEDRLVGLLWALTGFETYDALAGDHDEAVATLRDAARTLAGLGQEGTGE